MLHKCVFFLHAEGKHQCCKKTRPAVNACSQRSPGASCLVLKVMENTVRQPSPGLAVGMPIEGAGRQKIITNILASARALKPPTTFKVA